MVKIPREKRNLKSNASNVAHQLMHPIFQEFDAWTGESDGIYRRDFLGVKTDPKFRTAWEARPAGKRLNPGYPIPTPQYLEWVFVLSSVLEAKNQFTMFELGAGYAPWLVRSACAIRQKFPDISLFLVGVEGSATYYKWMLEHFQNNDLLPQDHLLLNALVSDGDSTAYFPEFSGTSNIFGAKLITPNPNLQGSPENITETKTVSLSTLLSKTSSVVDLIHMDIQGQELSVLTNAIDLVSEKVKRLLVGTHSDVYHDGIYELMYSHGWLPRYNFGWRSNWNTEWGDFKFGDGLQCWVNSRLISQA